MLCLSGFELYPRWVPLILFMSVYALCLQGTLYDK